MCVCRLDGKIICHSLYFESYIYHSIVKRDFRHRSTIIINNKNGNLQLVRGFYSNIDFLHHTLGHDFEFYFILPRIVNVYHRYLVVRAQRIGANPPPPQTSDFLSLVIFYKIVPRARLTPVTSKSSITRSTTTV